MEDKARSNGRRLPYSTFAVNSVRGPSFMRGNFLRTLAARLSAAGRLEG
jgi:hypothetical protein